MKQKASLFVVFLACVLFLTACSCGGKQISGIQVKSKPTKLSYTVGETLDLSGGTLLVTYSDKSKKEVKMTKDMVDLSKIDMSKAGKKTVTVTYVEGKVTKSVTFDIQVAEKTQEETPAVTMEIRLPEGEIKAGQEITFKVYAKAEKELGKAILFQFTLKKGDLAVAEQGFSYLVGTSWVEFLTDTNGKVLFKQPSKMTVTSARIVSGKETEFKVKFAAAGEYRLTVSLVEDVATDGYPEIKSVSKTVSVK